jgi:hypothetical protein
MSEENGQEFGPEALARGRNQFRWLAIASLAIHAILLVEELITWNAIGFVIVEVLFIILLAVLWYVVGQRGRLRWLLFMAQLFSGVYGFLLGGLHLKDPMVEAIDPLCYWLVAAGLALLGIGGYFIYSIEIDAYLKHLRGREE